ncbi:hypothetical protein EPUS_06171 [Endocarpon pusillum Z07020]|uniref:Heterokaryon incompatibility domain-containing protein n=1 Tax=Endocarpon pusillum (strain Z07020 / HMAS-L-300199) TaxID=1263415 RepID=U1GVK2_ENDPU|nr:uncharacterized protein EPUS_06171 [Endocarpon pusillum Z07020]ERF76508.1 hypothetical protein EPUS_06171 [Endocarpon pusillum Z07020]
MWLLKTVLNEDGSFSPALEEFEGQEIPEYAILSHTWDEEEILFADVMRNPQNACFKKGFMKIEKAAERARIDGHTYIWIDTCCISKESSAELQEAINSMYIWYERAVVCYAYLFDVHHLTLYEEEEEGFETALRRSRWFTRGWCLQELLAPRTVVFFSSEWTKIGTKASIAKLIASITSIDVDYLTGLQPIRSASVAKKMSWAAHRQTRRIEDTAYCLMGIFSVNMTMLYGEGSKAFLRLQKRIWKQYEDQSLFMWLDPGMDPDTPHGLLADSPAVFANTGHCYAFDNIEGKSPVEMTSKGVRVYLRVMYAGKNCYEAALNCTPALFSRHISRNIASIYLRKLDWGVEQFVRVQCNYLGHLHDDEGSLQTVFIPQQIHERNIEHILYPRHTVHLRKNSQAVSGGAYTLIDMAYDALGTAHDETSAATVSSVTDIFSKAWAPSPFPRQFEIFSPRKLIVALLFRRLLDGEQVAIILGTDEQSRVGFCALPTRVRKLESISDFETHFNDSNGNLEPTGSVVQLQWHRVEVFSETQFFQSYRISILDFNLEAIWDNEEAGARTATTSNGATTMSTTEPAFQFHSSNLKTLKFYSDYVGPVAYSPDGKQIACLSYNSIKLCDSATGKTRHTFSSSPEQFWAATFSLNGKDIISISKHLGVRIQVWDLNSKKEHGDLEYITGYSDSLSAVAFSPDGKQIAFYSPDDKQIRLWNRATGAEGRIFIGHSRGVSATAFSPDGKIIASASYDKTVRLWDLATGVAYGTFEGHSKAVRAIAFSPDGKQIASASNDTTVRLWDSATRTENATFKGHSKAVRAIAFSPDGKQIASASDDMTVRLWELATRAASSTLRGHSDAIRAIAFSPDGKQIVSASDDHTVRLWNSVTRAVTSTSDK